LHSKRRFLTAEVITSNWGDAINFALSPLAHEILEMLSSNCVHLVSNLCPNVFENCMMTTLRASITGIQKAQAALKSYHGKHKTYLAGEAGCSRTKVYDFFKGQKVQDEIFKNICTALDLDWRSIADLETAEIEIESTPEIDILVQTIRKQVSPDILHRCGKMRILDMEQEIEYGDIYSSVNILEKITGHDRSKFDEMLASCQQEDFDRLLLGKVKEERVPGLEAVDRYSKLMILGKPGAGKTTFMKRLAILCNRGEFQSQRIPIFVSLKEFAEAEAQPKLLEYIDRQWSEFGVATAAKILLGAGQGLVLLDGLDEVREDDNKRVLKEIKNFTLLYRDCQIVITCRIAAWEYKFESFTEVEVADFDEDQITEFVNKWFQTKGKPLTADRMLTKLKNRQPVMELATNPLLLTLLCLIFGNGSDFPTNRSELYKEGLDVLLKKWDAKRDIDRHQIYKKLSLKRKEDLLSQLAFDTFDRGEYFFKQSTVERYITEYIRNIPGTATDEEALQLDSEAVLRSIMAQHGLLVERAKGIFSFSHLTFHEYFAAKRIVDSSIAQGNEGFLRLAKNVTHKRWREVFFLVVEMLPDASGCLLTIKQEIDGLLAGDERLQEYLVWLDEKCQSIDDIETKPMSIYLSYLIVSEDIYMEDDLASSHVFVSLNNKNASAYLQLDLHLKLSTIWFGGHSPSNELISLLQRSFESMIAQSHELKCNKHFTRRLKSLKKQMPSEGLNYLEWKKESVSDWQQKLIALMIKYRNIGHDWKFMPEQKSHLTRYCIASKLLEECLESECYIDLDTRQYITDTFCRPLHLIPPRS
jgi:predicted NACHT family NTPase